jgi:adenosylmethionine-8-amino-7-oxononanoate aminotransferase
MKRRQAKAKSGRRSGAVRSAAPKAARKAAVRGAGKTAAPGGARRRARVAGAVVADAAIARATARAQASVRAELRNKTRTAEILTQNAINEAEEIGLLLDNEEEDESEEGSGVPEEDAYFVRGSLGPPHARIRPAPGIESGRGEPAPSRKERRGDPAAARGRKLGRSRGAAATAEAAAPRPARAADHGLPPDPEAAHLFPRNLRLRYPVAVKGEGVWIEDKDGRRYLDGCSGAVVCSIGHGVREVADVMSAQARRLAFAHSSQFITRETMELSARIAALAPGDLKKTGRVYLVSGGSEAVETAIKMARQYHVERGRPSKYKVISRWQSYHGSTMGALAATGNVARREIYTPLIQQTPHIAPCFCYRCPFGLKFPKCDIACADDLERVIRQEGPDTIAAFMAEPVVGATLGAAPAVEGYWPRLREVCDRHDILLIADEVMTGIGRTGKNFAIDHYKVVPDLIVTGKGLSAGYTPLGAVIARGRIADAIRAGRGYFEHGFTYSANPLSAAIGNAVLAYIAKRGLVARAAKLGALLGERLQRVRRHAMVGDIRGIGMMWGIEIVKSRATREPFPATLKVSRRLYEACLAEGLLVYPGSGTREGQDGDHFIVAPPFTIERDEIDELVGRLDRGLAALAKSLA